MLQWSCSSVNLFVVCAVLMIRMVEEEVLSGGSSSVGAADAWESVLSPLGLALEESSMPPPDNDTADTHPTRKNRGEPEMGHGLCSVDGSL
jgi:hypothetical protein